MYEHRRANVALVTRLSVTVGVLAASLFVTTTSAVAIGTGVSSGSPGGLITPSGVVVAVDRVFAGYWITTPCGRNERISEGTPLESVDVVIDPGHGGPRDTGAVAPTGLIERDLNLVVAKEAERVLGERGVSVVLTRNADYGSTLTVRANLADRLNARVLVSIHHNGPSPGPSPVPGVEVFIQNGSAESRRLGGLLWEEAMAALGQFDVDWVAASDSGVMIVLNTRGDDAYGIIRHPNVPTALIELGHISNRSEADLHATEAYVRAAGQAVADAVAKFLKTNETGGGFGEGRVFDPNPGLAQDRCNDPFLGVGFPS